MNLTPASSTFRAFSRVWAFAAFCALWTALPAGAGPSAVVVKTVSEDAISGRLVEFSLDHGLVVHSDDQDQPRRIATGDVVQILTDEPSLSLLPQAVRLELVGGDLLFGRVTGFAEDVVSFETATVGQVPVPLERITAWKSATSHPQLPPVSATSADWPPRGDEDALLLTNGDVVRGAVSAIDENGFVVETALGETSVEHESILAAVMLPIDSATGGPPRGPHLRVLTTDGQRLTASALRWSEVSATATIFDGTPLRIPADRIARVDVLGGRWEWLTSLEPISYEHTPALSLDWDWVADRNVTGGPIRVAGTTYEHGLGVHSQCSITFDLKGAHREFVTSMGLDDDSGPYANVDIEIRVDGQRRFAEEGITPGTLHGPVRLDVTGAKRIKLTVLFGANADLQDRFNWVGPALIR